MMDDPREEALAEAKRTYAGFITFLKWLSLSGLHSCDPTASQSDPSWKEDYMSNMEIDE